MSGPLTLGTAGHIDHGKTALIAALTGTDTDRLPQEQARGISIELGYAKLKLPSGRQLSVIDAPGHERFVRTMVAGATGIDVYLMVVAADDGVMPQTREHATVLEALAIGQGVVAVTKIDIADPAQATLEAAELLPGAEIVAVSARSHAGLHELLAALERASARASSRAQTAGAARLHIDRAFTIRGAGTVITGTLWGGTISRGDEVRLLPRGQRSRVRGVQVHDERLQRAHAGQRVAVNLIGVPVSDVERGDVLTTPDSGLAPTYLLDVRLDHEPAARVQVHHGTRETPARTAHLGGDYWQLRLEQPLVPAPGDRVVIRQIAPPDTLGGGIIIDAHPRKHGASRPVLVRLERLARGERVDERVPATARPEPSASAAPPSPGLSPSALALEQQLRDAGLEPPPDAELDRNALAALREAGRAVRVSRKQHYHADALEQARQRIIGLADRNDGAVTLAQLRDALGTSRKFAQALLEHFDSEKLTIRRGDVHVLRRGAR